MFKDRDMQSWKALLDKCLAVAPKSKASACDVFYRWDLLDEITELANEMLEKLVGECTQGDRVAWVEARE